ncbi:MAG: DoxX family protein [Weeksellaceae bacterium]
MEHITEFFILIMLAIALVQSGIDKILDWKGNLEWLTGHFSKTPFKNMVPFNLAVILVLEMAAGLLSLVGAILLVATGSTMIALWAAVLSAINFIFLFLGQRIAKEYVGAQTIVVYLIPTFFLIYLLTV